MFCHNGPRSASLSPTDMEKKLSIGILMRWDENQLLNIININEIQCLAAEAELENLLKS